MKTVIKESIITFLALLCIALGFVLMVSLSGCGSGLHGALPPGEAFETCDGALTYIRGSDGFPYVLEPVHGVVFRSRFDSDQLPPAGKVETLNDGTYRLEYFRSYETESRCQFRLYD
jgi:hypothetical protein